MDKQTLVFELNEFNRELLFSAAKAFQYKNICWMFDNFNESVAYTPDVYESDLLEPWVQWVSVHTGRPSDEHKVKHLGDVPDLKVPQIWELLSDEGKTSVVSGVLNGRRGEARNCVYFLPDPWTFSENAFPVDYQDLLTFPRYMAKNRLRSSKTKALVLGLRFIFRLSRSPVAVVAMFRFAPKVLINLVRHKGAEFVGFTFAEYLLGLLFLDVWRAKNPNLGIVFMNSLAHVQHYYWTGDKIETNRQLKYCLYFIDQYLGHLREAVRTDKGANMIVVNALSQMNTSNEREWVSYRPKDHAQFLKLLGIRFSVVEALMSYDATIFFQSEADRDAAHKVLSSIRVCGMPLLLVENYPEHKTKLFYRLNFTDAASPDTHFIVGNNAYSFFGHFEKIVTRTAKHVPRSSVFSLGPNIPKFLRNHELCRFILDSVR